MYTLSLPEWSMVPSGSSSPLLPLCLLWQTQRLPVHHPDLTAPKTSSDMFIVGASKIVSVFGGDKGALCSTIAWNALALKNTQRVIATPSRPSKNTKNHLNAGACADLPLWFRLNTLVKNSNTNMYTSQRWECTTFSSVPSKWNKSTPIPLRLSLSACNAQLTWSNTKQ
jgi:hypothetical protein